jgi:hypothetical protein
MKSNIGTGRAKKEMRAGYLMRVIVRGLRRAKWRPSVSVCTVVVGRKIAQSSWNVPAFKSVGANSKVSTFFSERLKINIQE